MLLFIQIGLRESDLRESMFPGFPFPKFPSEAEDVFNENRKGFLSQVKLIKSNGDNTMTMS